MSVVFSEERVQAALRGPSAEVLRLVALQPRRKPSIMPPDAQLIPVPGR